MVVLLAQARVIQHNERWLLGGLALQLYAGLCCPLLADVQLLALLLKLLAVGQWSSLLGRSVHSCRPCRLLLLLLVLLLLLLLLSLLCQRQLGLRCSIEIRRCRLQQEPPPVQSGNCVKQPAILVPGKSWSQL